MFPKISDEEKSRLRDYADVADELQPGGGLGMDDLDERSVKKAQDAAREFGLSWPPVLAWEDEVREAGLYGG